MSIVYVRTLVNIYTDDTTVYGCTSKYQDDLSSDLAVATHCGAGEYWFVT